MTWPPRIVPPPAARRRRKNDNPEERLQKAVVGYLDIALPKGCGVFWSAVMNGVRVSV